ncbi:anti-sigma factor [Pontibacter sp. CAU 1760]
MNNDEYIASGILELYAAGALSQEEKLEVEHRAADSPEVHAALQEACRVMEEYASLYAVAPNPALKNRILNQIGHSPSDDTIVAEEDEQPVRPLYPVQEPESSPYKWMFAASIALFLLSGFMSIRFYQNWQNAEDKLAQALALEQTMAQNYQTASYRLNQQEQALQVLRSGDFRLVRLQGVEGHADAQVLVYWNAAAQQVYIDPLQLPAPPAGKQYQLWALLDGKPIDAGLISLKQGESRELLQPMKGIGAAQAFAVTLEPAGGSVNPTLEQLYVMGEVSS